MVVVVAAQSLALLIPFSVSSCHHHPTYRRLKKPIITCRSSSFNAWGWNVNRGKNRVIMVSGGSSGHQEQQQQRKRRKVVEHICFLKANKDLSDEQEKDMLDYLFTTQYQMPGILAISLGRISDTNVENFSHAVFMRFQRKEDLAKFYQNPFYSGVLKEHVIPYCHGLTNVDYESEVEDDLLPIFRKGEDFNTGLEFVLLITFSESAIDGPAKDALASLQALTEEHQSLIVQCTQGSNFNSSSEEYTHGVIIRFRSFEALEIFINSSEYKNVWNSKFQPIAKKTIAVNFSVEPVGTEIM
ncbi:hypothetical protein SLE2022_337190 [Rubroshorea leprosula]